MEHSTIAHVLAHAAAQVFFMTTVLWWVLDDIRIELRRIADALGKPQPPAAKGGA